MVRSHCVLLCSIHFYRTSLSFFYTVNWCQLSEINCPCLCCGVFLHTVDCMYLSMSTLLLLHLLIWATRATGDDWSGLLRHAIYETIEMCLRVFHSNYAEMWNVNNNNLQVFKSCVITFHCEHAFERHVEWSKQSVVMVWVPCNGNWLQNM